MCIHIAKCTLYTVHCTVHEENHYHILFLFMTTKNGCMRERAPCKYIVWRYLSTESLNGVPLVYVLLYCNWCTAADAADQKYYNKITICSVEFCCVFILPFDRFAIGIWFDHIFYFAFQFCFVVCCCHCDLPYLA